MIKKLAWVACFMIVFGIAFGSSAIATRAQTAVDPNSVSAGDPRIIFPDACPTNAFCADLTTGPVAINIPECGHTILGGDAQLSLGTCSDYLFIGVATGPISVPPVWTCTSDYTAGPPVVGFLQHGPNGTISPTTFTGCSFADGNIPADTTISFGVQGLGGTPPPYVTLVIPPGFVGAGDDITLAPEPATWLLFMSGLLLFGLGGFFRKKLGANLRA